jgi:small subunit ribosomal protein S14
MIERNNRRVKLSKQFEEKRKALKETIANKKTPMDERFAAAQKLAELPRNSSKTRIRNRCEVTGRPRGYYRKLKMSRISLRDLASMGMIPGMVKSSW